MSSLSLQSRQLERASSHWSILLRRLPRAIPSTNGVAGSARTSGAVTWFHPSAISAFALCNTCCRPLIPVQQLVTSKMSGISPPVVAASDAEVFMGLLNRVKLDLAEDQKKDGHLESAFCRLKEVLEYNLTGGKKNRGLSVVASYRQLASPSQKTEDNITIAMIIGLCVELLQASLLVADDIMDNSTMRRGKPCWYKKEGVGLFAINDSFLLKSMIYELLKKYCMEKPFYLNVLELFLQVSYKTELGQALDLLTAQPDKIDFSSFTEERYETIAKYKTAFYSFYLPIAAAMYMVEIVSKEAHASAEAILLEMGQFFQIQDDYLDCYGEPEVTGKVGTDIEDNKCSWLIVQALKIITPEQRTLLEENYGCQDPAKVACVKAVYTELNLQTVYQQYEDKSYARLMSLIDNHSTSLPKVIFLELAQRLYKRQK
uniref:farnesyl pyrophosphate synthase-like isoform X1 n=1 Tax=Myxine glutinosa TaxID=7769 RepID=UPI00358F7F12